MWLFHPLTGTGYQFYSGIGSDLSELTLLVALLGWYKHNQCHVDGCHKLGKHPFNNYKLCRKHHPEMPEKITHLHILKKFKENNNE